MAGEQNDSDPLPFVQVDRSVDPKAVNFAKLVQIPFDHALGSLVQWFRQNADVRELQKVLDAAGPEGKAALVLSDEALRRRFRVSTGFNVEPLDLVEIGLVEKLPDGYRVRGMSRYFEPLRKRAHLRELASAGGKASAKTRADRYGSASPSASSAAEAHASSGAEAHASRVARSAAEVRDQRSEDRDQSTEDKGQTPLAGAVAEKPKPKKKPKPQATLPGIPEPPPKARALSWQEELYAAFAEARANALFAADPTEFDPAAEEHPGPAYINAALGQILEPIPADERALAWSDLFDEFFKSPAAAAKRFPFRYLCATGVWRKHAREALAAIGEDSPWRGVNLQQQTEAHQ